MKEITQKEYNDLETSDHVVLIENGKIYEVSE